MHVYKMFETETLPMMRRSPESYHSQTKIYLTQKLQFYRCNNTILHITSTAIMAMNYCSDLHI